MAGFSAKKQAKLVGDGVHYVQTAMGGPERDAWLKSLRPGDVARVARLSVLAVPSSKSGPRPGSDFVGCIVRLMQRGVRIEEAESGVTSDDKEAFAKAVETAADDIAKGRRLASNRAREIGATARNLAIERSAATAIQKPGMKRWHKIIRGIWGNKIEYPSRAAAADAVNAIMRENGLPELGSARTIERAFEALGQPLRRR